MSANSETLERAEVPFDVARVDRLMEEAGIDVLLVTSKHNVRYLLGGYRFIFFSTMDAIGHSRYLPVVIYRKGRLDDAAYLGNRMEAASTPTTRSGRRPSGPRPPARPTPRRWPPIT